MSGLGMNYIVLLFLFALVISTGCTQTVMDAAYVGFGDHTTERGSTIIDHKISQGQTSERVIFRFYYHDPTHTTKSITTWIALEEGVGDTRHSTPVWSQTYSTNSINISHEIPQIMGKPLVYTFGTKAENSKFGPILDTSVFTTRYW